MELSVNFLRVRRKTLSQVQKNDQKYLRWMSTGFVISVVIAISAFGVDFFFSKRIQTIQAKQAEVSSTLSSLKPIEQEYLVLAKKAEEIQKLLSNRKGRSDTVKFFTTLFTDNTVSMKEMYFSEEGIFQASVVSQNIFHLRTALDKLQTAEIRERFENISLSEMQRNLNGEYVFQITVVPKNPKK